MSDKAMLHARWDASELASARFDNKESPFMLHTSILAYEVGDFIKCALNTYWGGIRGYHGEAKIALADILTQLRILAHELNIETWEAMRIGEERYMERMTQFREEGRS